MCDEKKLSTKLIYFWFVTDIDSKEFEDQKDRFATGTTQIAINSSALDKILIPFDSTIEIINKKLKPIYQAININELEISKLQEVQRIIISKLVQQ